MKDRSYHESAIVYNEGLAIAAEEQADRVEHPIPKKWNNAVAKQHRFHEERHRRALAKLVEREESLDPAATPDLDENSNPVVNGTGV